MGWLLRRPGPAQQPTSMQIDAVRRRGRDERFGSRAGLASGDRSGDVAQLGVPQGAEFDMAHDRLVDDGDEIGDRRSATR